MQRFVNNPDFIVDDMLKGLVKANPEVRFSEGPKQPNIQIQ